MKKILVFLMSCVCFVALADWNYGTAQFKGNQPSNKMSIGGVEVWYEGTLRNTHSMGGVDYWEGTGDICVAFPRNYNGRQLNFSSTGGSVQIQYLK